MNVDIVHTCQLTGMGKEIKLLFWGWLAGDGGGEALALGEEVETGAGGDGEDCRSTQGRLTTSQTPVRISQSISLHRQRKRVGQGDDHRGTQKGRCWKWGPTGFII